MTLRKALVTAIIVLSVILCTMVTGTLAWLSDKTETVTNTFTPSNITVMLTETDSNQDSDNDANTNSYKMVPGATIIKQADVSIAANSEACYVFIRITENLGAWSTFTQSFEDYLDYDVANDWTILEGVSGVYYLVVDATKAQNGASFGVLAGDEIRVHGVNVTKEMMNALYEPGAKYPTLTFEAYAIQSANLPDQDSDSIVDAKDAWALLNANP